MDQSEVNPDDPAKLQILILHLSLARQPVAHGVAHTHTHTKKKSLGEP